ncbi:MAG: HAMP domain-containing histidine kinase [Bacteroides sp.]|nr:HAMP domain-containing histidine kinase [Bacteroides sp.]MCM1457324.1 HAMP domain-containing histidine kinase [Lachnoclostridium sp.]
MANIYDIRRWGKVAFLVAAACVVAVFLYVSNNLIDDLAAQERQRMQIWADATREIISISALETSDADIGQALAADIDFLLSIIESNTTIPVLLTDDDGNILQHRNFPLPEPVDSLALPVLSDANERFLKDKLATLATTTNVIHITIARGFNQHLYYEDSTLLKRLSYYPYVQLLVMLVFIAVVYFAVLSTKKAEQNKVWVGLSKETAHQLGTPISSLMAWMELLPDMGVDADTVAEMDKDVRRLETIASRFSKIGSVPKMEDADLGTMVDHATSYMSTRISPNIKVKVDRDAGALPVEACPPLLGWVMENLVKNAVDAMEGHGTITVTTGRDRSAAWAEVTDTGKGISRKNFKNVFNPGFTTKKRGWGLGLTLAKRIIEEYHRGKIYVKASTPGQGTTFRIEMPLKS